MVDKETTIRQIRDGRAQGLAIAALALGLISFLNLLGAEKAILTMLLGVFALRSTQSDHTRKRAYMAIGLSIVYVVTIGIVLLIFGDEFAELLNALRALG